MKFQGRMTIRYPASTMVPATAAARGSSLTSGVSRDWPTIGGNRPDRRFGDGRCVPCRVGLQQAAVEAAGGIAVLHRPNSRLRAVVYPDLSHNRFHVDLDRRLGDVARARNHLV